MSARVLITDGEERAALAACRGLASAGYRVTVVARHRPAATHWSRSCAERLLLPDARQSVSAFIAGLEEVLAARTHSAVIPGSDASLWAISDHRDSLETFTRLGLPPRDVVRRCLDKVALLDAAEAAGLASPESRSCASSAEAADAAAELGYPVVVKPVSSFRRAGGGLSQQSVVVVQDANVLARVAPAYEPSFLVQRFEHARFLSCTGVIADGRLLGLTTSRVPRLWPPVAGMHSFSETVPTPEGLADRVRRLLGTLGWQGIFQFQMLESADGRFSVIDLNPRLFGSIALDVRAGANLAALWCDWLLGGSPTPVVARSAVRFRWEEGELCHLAWQFRRGRLRAAVAVLAPHRRVAHAWFRLRDPGPLLARALSLALRSFSAKRGPHSSVDDTTSLPTAAER
jgi:predicted ATP-grasp superfamily ATP-dependent carboligase